ncbi:hypothetical protein J4208_03810 [Candidatus Woesearchaeota archaeon]|nr:hypothetical protein [Candidatus Woesearchaeota archaeon]
MRLSQPLMEELVKEVAGDDVLALLRLILGKSNVSEFKIAEKLNITVNQVRNMLYRLNEHNLVAFTRKKDKEKGWYIYFWTFDTFNARLLIIERKQKKIAELKRMINEENTTGMYVCPSRCIRVNAQQALDLEYKCTTCNTLLKEEDSRQLVEKTKNYIEKLRAELNEALAAEEERLAEAKPAKKKGAKEEQQKKPVKKIAKKKPVPKKNSKHKPKHKSKKSKH